MFYNYCTKLSIYFSLFCFVTITGNGFSQNSDTIKKVNFGIRKALVIGVTSTYTAGSLLYLNYIWYKPYRTSSFHFYDDNSEWCQMDKCGHVFTTYNTGRLMTQAMQRAGFKSRKSILIGETYGTIYMTTVEVMDGFSSGWGFSWGDELANVSGSALFALQQYFWKEQRLQLKFSFHQSPYAKYRPSELGGDLSQQIIKDYNGQSYWLSLNISSFLKKKNNFPKWLNLAFGYGAEDMISGQDNYYITTLDGKNIGKNRYRKLYFSLDVDLTKIKTKSVFLKTIFSIFNSFKVPFPTVEFNKNGITAHPFFL